MRIVVIGGSGHIGTFLVPRLVRAGHEVLNVSRGTSSAYADAREWQQVQQVTADREEAGFPDRVADLRPDVVVDLVCFTLTSAVALVERLRGSDVHLLHCGSIWRYGPSHRIPITETTGTPPFGEYGIEKDRIARMLLEETELTTTSLHPGHIVGPGWAPINPVGNLELSVWQTLAAGKPLQIPSLGAEMLHHVHADDVAQAFELAVEHRDAAAGEDFNVVAPSALTVRGYASEAAGWFGQSAQLETVTWDEFNRSTAPEAAEATWEHLVRSHCASIDKAKTVLGYAPRYEPLDAIHESVDWLIAHNVLDAPPLLTI